MDKVGKEHTPSDVAVYDTEISSNGLFKMVESDTEPGMIRQGRQDHKAPGQAHNGQEKTNTSIRMVVYINIRV